MLQNLKNTYFFMRHGESEANVAGIIVSDPEQGCHGYGLTEKGRLQVLHSVTRLNYKQITAIISSDFLRARQTAEIVADQFNLSAPVLEIGLRERWFGDWDGQSDSHYNDVWLQDEETELAGDKKVETVEEVLQRGLNVIDRLEGQYHHETLLLVSHGDLLQILRTAFSAVEASRHRDLPHHQTAEIDRF